MAKTDIIVVDSEAAGIPHPPGTEVRKVPVAHPEGGDGTVVFVPVDHDGSAIKVQLPDGTLTQIEGFDPADRAQHDTRVVVQCGSCGADQVARSSFACSACGARNKIEVVTSGDAGVATEEE